jgi:signal transduction histidine kinase
VEGEFRLRHANGSWQWMQNRDTVFMRDESGIPTLILGAALDISERKKYEHALNEANNKLSETNQLLTDANNLKTELLGIAAHDLKNPLIVIKNLATILEENSQEEVVELSAVIKQASQDMLALINELLESSALDSGRYPIHIENINLAVLLEYVIQGNTNAAQKKKQKLIVKAEQQCFIMADGSSMRRVLDNLISNAIKYSPFEKNIEISLVKKDKYVRLEVCDQGPGLDEEDMKKIFGKFQRLHAQPTGGENSSGLGLSIVKQIVDLHHGKVWAESKGIGKGTTFVVEMPFKS